MFYWFMKHVVAGPLLRTLFRPQVIDAQNIPKTGAVILASNHLSFIDSVILPLVIKRRVHFLAGSNYFTGHGFGSWALKRFLLATGMIPIDRSGGKASEASLAAGLTVLDQGKMLGIYPEGSRSKDGRMHRGRTGVARMILAADAVVVPVAMSGTDKVLGVGSKALRLERVGIRFGAPLDFERFRNVDSDRAVLRAITDEIMVEIQRMSGQEYVDAYTSSRKS
jgi:1-acyl-sn-glycerol-3-phosphate acyltransferase